MSDVSSDQSIPLCRKSKLNVATFERFASVLRAVLQQFQGNFKCHFRPNSNI